jgi:hypothetical protein
MTKLPNINCIHYEWGMCNKKPRRRFGLFRTNCPEVEGKVCTIKERHPKPPAPLPPPPKRILNEDVKIRPLTEGKVRGGMSSNAMKKTYSWPVHPPMPGKKNTTQDESSEAKSIQVICDANNQAEILKKVEKKEFVKRCIAVDICPTCGGVLKSWGVGKICPECDIVFGQK